MPKPTGYPLQLQFASIGGGMESGLASVFRKSSICPRKSLPARVVELADTRVLEALAARLTGSSPVPGISLRRAFRLRQGYDGQDG
jgi:hypothetical protein